MSQLTCDTQAIDAPPRIRKNPQLWQAYQMWNEVSEMRKRHNLRIDAARRKVSQLDPTLEEKFIEMLYLDAMVEPKNKFQKSTSIKTIMVEYGKALGPIWDWTLAHKGMGEGLTAQLLAQLDDISHYETVSKMWRYAGFAVFDGKAESKGEKGEKRHYNSKLKGICYNIADMFIRQQTPYYIDIYYAEKKKQRELHPVPFCVDCNVPAEQYQKKVNGEKVTAHRCPKHKKEHTVKWSDLHVHTMAWRKMVKEFLKDLWIEWSKPSL